MTMIADYPTKKAFKEAIAADPGKVYITDPALMQEWLKFGVTQFTVAQLQPSQSFIVTNHPKRSWFATVQCIGDNKFRVA